MSFIRNTDKLVEGLQNKWFTNERAKSAVQSDLNQLSSDVSTEVSARQSADSNLQSQINTEKGRIDAILSAADADKDSFAEIVSLINSVDASNDSAFAGYVSSNNAAVAAISGRVSSLEADPTTKAYVDGINSALDSRLDVLEADPTTRAYVDGVQSALDARLDSLELDSVTQAYVDSADNALDARLDIIEGADNVEGSVAKAEKDAKDYADGLNSAEVSARQSADNALDARLDIIEGADSVEGSVAKAEKDAKDYADGIVSAEATSRSNEDLTFFKLNGSRNLTGNVLFNTDASNNIGAVGANRPNKEYLAYGLQIGGSTDQLGAGNNNSLFVVADSDIGTDPRIAGVRYSDSSSAMHRFSLRKSRGSLASPSALQTGDSLGRFTWSGMGDAGSFRDAAQIVVKASDAFTNSSSPGYMQLQVTPSGSTTLATAVQINSDKSVAMYGNASVNFVTSSSSERAFLVDGATGLSPVSSVRVSSNSAFNGPVLALERSRDNAGTPDYLASGDMIGQLGFRAWDGSTYNVGRARIVANAVEQHSAGAAGTKMVFQATAAGGTTRVDVMEIFGDKVNFLKNAEVPVDWSLSRPADAGASRGYAKMVFADFTDPSSNNQTQIKFDLRRNSSDATERLPLTLQVDHAILGRGLSYRVIRKSANYTVPNSEPIQVAQAVNITYTLPLAPIQGQVHTFKDSTGSCNNSNPITIRANSGLVGSTIDGSASYQLTAAYEAISMVYDSTLNMWLLI